MLLTIICLLTMVSCKHRYPVSLLKADSLIYTNPQLALRQLDSVSENIDTANSIDVMFLRLLKMMAKNKICMSAGNLNDIQELVDYFESHDDARGLSLAYYLLGRKMGDLHEISQSLTYYHKALEVLETDKNIRLEGLVNLQIGYLMQDLDDLNRAREFYGKAYSCDSLVGDKRSMASVLRDLAVILMNQKEGKKAKELLYRSLEFLPHNDNGALKNDIRLQLANYYLYELNDLDSVCLYLEPSLQCSHPSASACFIASEYYWEKEKVDISARYLDLVLKIGDEYDKQETYRRKIQIASYDNNLTDALGYLDQYINFGDSVKLRREFERKQNGLALFEYSVQKEKIESLKSQNVKKIIGIIVLLFLIVIIVVVFLFYYQLSIVHKLKLKDKINDIKRTTRLMVPNIEARKLAIRKKIGIDSFLVNKSHLSPLAWEMLDEEVNRLFVGFKDRLLGCSSLSDNEYHVCLLMKIGVSTGDIAMLTSHSKSSVSMTKRRLFMKITKKKGGTEDFEMLLRNL